MKFDHSLACLILAATAGAQAPAITNFAPLGMHSYATGSVTLFGSNLDAVTRVTLDGVVQSIVSQSSTQLTFDKAPAMPGLLKISVEAPTGTVEATETFSSTPALTATTGIVGESLQVTIHNGAPGFYVLGLGAGILPSPIAVPPSYFGLVLNPALPLVTIGSGSVSSSGSAVKSLSVPNDASLVGAGLQMQAWATQGVSPVAPSSFTNSVSLQFYLSVNEWYTKQPLTTARRALGSVAIDGIVYAIGGANTGGATPLARLDAYNPSTNEWKPRAAMNKARFYLAAAALDGRIYAIGGSDAAGGLADVESYDPSTDSWSVKAPMNTPRSNLAAAALNGRIYAIGGHQPEIYPPTALDVVEAYDPVTNTWSPKKNLPKPSFALVAVASGGHIYAIGGQGTWSDVFKYDPVTDMWSEKAPILTPRSGAGAAAAYGKIYVIGGAPGGSNESDKVEAYDPLQNKWSNQWKLMPTKRRELACAFAGGFIYAIGGATGVANDVQAAVELYAP